VTDGVVRSRRPLGATAVRLPSTTDGGPAAEIATSNRAAWERSVEVVGRLLPGVDVAALAGAAPDECLHARPDTELHGLLTVGDLDAVLRTHLVPTEDQPSGPAPKVGHAGGTLPLDELVQHDGVAQERRGARLQAYGLSQALRQGASLYLTTAAGHHPPLARLVEHLRRVLGGSAQCGVFVSRGPAPVPFEEHWDATENVCFQLVGRRRWRVRRPSVTDNHPALGLGRGVPGELAWEGELAPGDALVVPRSWWHEVEPVDPGLSMHVTVGVNRPVPHDALRWLLPTAAADPALRTPLGHPEAAAADGLGALRDLLAGADDLDDAFLAHLQARELPAALPGVGPLALLDLATPADLVVRRALTGHVAIAVPEDPTALALAAGGQVVEIDPTYASVAAAALAGAPISVDELVASGPAADGVVSLVDQLLRLDWLTTARPGEPPLVD
jgi:hypothetical protein